MTMIEQLRRRAHRLLWQAKLLRSHMLETVGEILSAHEALANDLEQCRILQAVPVRIRAQHRRG